MPEIKAPSVLINKIVKYDLSESFLLIFFNILIENAAKQIRATPEIRFLFSKNNRYFNCFMNPAQDSMADKKRGKTIRLNAE
jgi:hypothetical protein